ncbi:class I SAM-dependent methyltransferase [Aquiflexum gelatinilyticum]|uniref:Class I SAM-dependent methyltransferase n=1 Tax=Aquiflexum gelatinilyticum TaxID=2961943 RepID=A0A9X2SYY7_9BACT|nr:class I SAM-dependent methyltransferase [Aquiflexum gelatinilyticum]MCR9013803.1 class I SAM-dependent methyltransferase [Aquiflexum gelatinilyticum]
MGGIKSKLTKVIYRNKFPIQEYKPVKKTIPDKTIQVASAWKGLELIIEDILDQFNIERHSCIEFGVEFGFSAVVFSNYFKNVTGVDIFLGDEHTVFKGDHYDNTKKSLSEFENIKLVRSDYKDWIKKENDQYDFAHVDIVHNYKETYECGLWAVKHSKCCIFHDTDSFPEVRRAVFDIAKITGKNAYNYPFHNGLGIIV